MRAKPRKKWRNFKLFFEIYQFGSRELIKLAWSPAKPARGYSITPRPAPWLQL